MNIDGIVGTCVIGAIFGFILFVIGLVNRDPKQNDKFVDTIVTVCFVGASITIGVPFVVLVIFLIKSLMAIATT